MNSKDRTPPAMPRRQVLGLLGAGIATATAPPGDAAAGRRPGAAAATPAPGPGGLDLDDPKVLLDSVVKLRGSLDARPVYVWMIGRRYVLTPDDRAHPLCAVRNVSITRWRRIADDAVELSVLEYNYNTDFASGEWRDSLVMPITGRSVRMTTAPAELIRHRWSLRHQFEGRLEDANEFPPTAQQRYGAGAQLTIDRTIHPPELLGDEMAFTQDWYLRIAPQVPDKAPWFVREVATVRGAIAGVADRRQPFVPSRTSYSIVYGFQPWMQLEGVQGQVFTAGFGGKTTGAGDLPRSIHQLLAAKNPEALGDPERLLRS